MDFPIPPEFWWSTDILLIINPSTGLDQEIHPCGQGRIDSVKTNPSLLRMRECEMSSLVEVKQALLLRPANQTLGIDRRGAAGRLHCFHSD